MVVLGVVLVLAQDRLGDPAWGQELARRFCGECHVVELSDWEPGGAEGALPFQAIADDPATTEFALRIFLRMPHGQRPFPRLTPDEIDDLIAYFLSLKGDGSDQ
jgi:mono/diheme cytochrome c family protein